MRNTNYPYHVCRLHKTIYGLKQPPALGTRSSVLSCSLSVLLHPVQTCLFFFYSCGNTLLYFLVYVEDLIITKSDPSLVNTIIQQLDSKFSAKDLGPLSYFCGVKVLATSTSLILSQQKYAIDLLTKHNMLNSKHVSTPLVICTSLAAHDGTTLINATTYHQVVGGLQHLRMTQSDISFVMNKLSQFMHASFGSG